MKEREASMQRDISVNTILVTFHNNEIFLSPTERIFPNFSLQRTFKSLSAQYSSEDVYFELLTVAEDRNFLRLYYWGLANYSSLKQEYIRVKPLSETTNLDVYQQLALKRLKRGVKGLNQHYISKLIEDEFTLEDVFSLYNKVVDEEVDKGNFHKLIKGKDLLEETGAVMKNVGYRPPRLYRFK